MSMRMKVLLVITLIALTVISFGIGVGMIFVQGKIEKSIETDMATVADIADKLVSMGINTLKEDAVEAANTLRKASDDEVTAVLREQVEAFRNFTSITIIGTDGIIASYGTSPVSDELLNSDYIQMALSGDSVISTMRVNMSNELVFHVCVPMGGQVLAATVPGTYFSDLISNFILWETGNIFILDREGTIIANDQHSLVVERFNSIEMSKTSEDHSDMAEMSRRMISGEHGASRYVIDGVERFCTFTPVTASKVGWSLGVTAPLSESPLRNVRNGLLIVGLFCLIFSVLAAISASLSIARPYKRISDSAKTLGKQSELLSVVNRAAVMLLGVDSDFDSDIRKSMDLMARSAGVDRMRLWKNETRNGKLYCTELYEWSEGAESQLGKEITIRISYDDSLPGWEERLSSGNCINGVVSSLSQAEQYQLMPQGILSLLVIPVFFRDHFWGFVGFDDCHSEREFSIDEENVFRSGSLLIASAILRNEIMLDLVQARKEAEASSAAKTDFLANMSHEMRTMLNAIIGLSSVALDANDMGDGSRENIEKVYSSGLTLLGLINDILDISKINSGKFELVPLEYDLPSVINDTISLNSVRIGSRPIEFHLDIGDELPRYLFGDELRVKQIFNNLLSNAFKYTNGGFVNWHIHCEDCGDDYVWLVSHVKDTGIGIRPKDIGKLFSDYSQVDAKSNHKREGTGLGLSICKNMVEMMDGTISVDSEYGKGSTFSVRIKQKKSGDAVMGAEISENLRKFRYNDHKRDKTSRLIRTQIPYAKVLVADDIQTNLDIVRGVLKPYAMRVDCVKSGREAVELIRAEKVRYNAIFMDHAMPGMDGVEAARIIREEIGTDYAKNIPIIALTANALIGNEEMFLKNGFQAFLSKPIDIMRMDVVINHWVRDREYEKLISGGDKHETERDIKEDKAEQILASLNIEGLDIADGLRYLGGDADSYLYVLKSYAQNTPQLLKTLRKCTEECLPDYIICVHGVKSSSKGIGAKEVGAFAEKLEFAAKSNNLPFILDENEAFVQSVERLVAGLSQALFN